MFKRFLWLITSFAILISLLVMPSFASGDELSDALCQIKWRYQSSSGFSSWYYDNLSAGQIRSVAYYNYRFKELTFSRVERNPFILTFRVYGYNPGDTFDQTQLTSFTSPSLSQVNSSTDLSYSTNSNVSSSFFRYRSEGPVVSNTHYTGNSIWFYLKCYPNEDNQNNLVFTLDSDLIFKLSGDYAFRLCFDHINYFSSNTANFQTIETLLDNGFSDVNTNLSALVQVAESMNTNLINIYGLLNSSSDSWNLSYDSDGVGSSSWSVGPVLSSIAASVASIGRYFAHHIDIENRAMESGAMSALEDQYDSASSSFGALGDFSGIGSIAPWNGSSVGSQGSDSFLDWFSQENADWLDMVPRSRSFSDDYISFYDDWLSDYYAAFGGDSD